MKKEIRKLIFAVALSFLTLAIIFAASVFFSNIL